MRMSRLGCFFEIYRVKQKVLSKNSASDVEENLAFFKIKLAPGKKPYLPV
jgi:hypothetical protein